MRLLPENRELGWAPYAWTVYVVFFIINPALNPHTSALEWGLTFFALAAFFTLYFRGYWASGREEVAIICGLTLLAALYYPFNPGAGCFFIYAAAFAGWQPTTKRAIWLMAIIEIVAIAESLLAHIHPFNAVWPVLFSVIIGSVNIHERQVNDSNARLRLAHDEIEHLAKVAERERIARDLHDLLGHTLSLIVLKSELASKLADRDVERARNEIRDVEQISRDALAQVRNAVRGYRAGGLRDEISEAQKTLTTANVVTSLDLSEVSLTPAQEAVLALAIREAVTNIVRHARATQCRISVKERDDECIVTVSDDGRGTNAPFGTGLLGMRERVESLHGRLVRDGSNGTTLTIAIPIAQPRALGAVS